MKIFENYYFEITEANERVYLKTMQVGFLLKDFDLILREFPRIKLTNFAVLKNVLAKQSPKPIEIGEWLPNLVIEVARDKMTAALFVYETVDFIRSNKESLLKKIKDLLAEHKIVHGVLPIHIETISPAKAILIAQGTPPLNGADAKVSYLEIPERKPVIQEDGTANYYDMNFIFEIAKGEWLGEKTPPEKGTSGTDILGNKVVAKSGKDIALMYDHKSAYEVEEEGKMVLRSRIDGVFEQKQGLISVSHHLPIAGDVGLETGNLEFDGSISVRGTIQPGYSIIARGDISIEGPEGVSGAKLIKSIDGDIYIRGGIFGLGQTQIEAGRNIYVKHVNEANLIAGNTIHIGFYAMGANLNALSIIVDERKGKIIGGTAIAKNQIVTAISGNRLERRTELIIHSINKQQAYALVQDKAAYLKAVQEEMVVLQEQVTRLLPVVSQLNTQQVAVFEQAKQNLNKYKHDANVLDQEIKHMMNNLRNAGKEEINVTKEAYPGTYIQIGKKSSILSKTTNGKFKLDFGELNV